MYTGALREASCGATSAHTHVPARLPQMHNLMEHFALEHNLAKVAELFAHMLENRMKPTTNTFRILITACQRAGQPELAFEVLSAMKARGLTPREVSRTPGCSWSLAM